MNSNATAASEASAKTTRAAFDDFVCLHRWTLPPKVGSCGQVSTAQTMIRIAIVDDHAMVRAGLRQFFSDQADFASSPKPPPAVKQLDIVRRATST